jgi:trimeric autotransporter adhesin
MNIYNGNVTTDTEGNATVVLPDYFEALNRDFRYQLTVIGKHAHAAVASEIENNRFTINTDQPGVKVSWQVTGIRQDASAKAFPSSVEEEKPEAERGLFLHPEHYGYSSERGIAFTRHPDRLHDPRAQRPRFVPCDSAASIE